MELAGESARIRTVGGPDYGDNMTDANTRIDSLKEDIREIGYTVLDLQARAAVHDSKLEQVLATQLAHDNRFDQIDVRLDGLENRFDGLENRFDGLENRFDGLEGRFDGLENRFEGRGPIRRSREPIRRSREPIRRSGEPGREPGHSIRPPGRPAIGGSLSPIGATLVTSSSAEPGARRLRHSSPATNE